MRELSAGLGGVDQRDSMGVRRQRYVRVQERHGGRLRRRSEIAEQLHRVCRGAGGVVARYSEISPQSKLHACGKGCAAGYLRNNNSGSIFFGECSECNGGFYGRSRKISVWGSGAPVDSPRECVKCACENGE